MSGEDEWRAPDLMQHVCFSAKGVPLPQPRPRTFQDRGGASRTTSNTGAVKAWRSTVAWAARAAMNGREPLTGPLQVRMTFRLPRPRRLKRKKDPAGAVYSNVRPDWDNLAKAVCDALGGVVWGDDGQVAWATVIKCFAEKPSEGTKEWTGVDVFVGEIVDLEVPGFGDLDGMDHIPF